MTTAKNKHPVALIDERIDALCERLKHKPTPEVIAFMRAGEVALNETATVFYAYMDISRRLLVDGYRSKYNPVDRTVELYLGPQPIRGPIPIEQFVVENTHRVVGKP